jgi:cobalt/nickel transport system permease protein
LHHVVLERWSRGSSPLHRRDPRVKAVALLVFLVVVATAQRHLPLMAAAWFVLLCAATLAARLPLAAAVARAAIVLSFTAVFALMSWLAGDTARALALVLKSYLSAFAVLLVVATTPVSILLHGLERLGAPRFLLMVTQFLYRYLFVISEEAQHMHKAALSRGFGSSSGRRRGRLEAAAGAVAALFARSYGRAEEIHRAMLARGFAGEFPALEPARAGAADFAFAAAAVLAPLAVRLVIERLA